VFGFAILSGAFPASNPSRTSLIPASYNCRNIHYSYIHDIYCEEDSGSWPCYWTRRCFHRRTAECTGRSMSLVSNERHYAHPWAVNPSTLLFRGRCLFSTTLPLSPSHNIAPSSNSEPKEERYTRPMYASASNRQVGSSLSRLYNRVEVVKEFPS